MRPLLSVVALAIISAGPALALARADEPRLGPQTALVRAACREVARLASDQRATLTVYCPPLVPYAPGIRREYGARGASAAGPRKIAPGYLISFASRSRFGPRWGGHWTLDVGRPADGRALASTVSAATRGADSAPQPGCRRLPDRPGAPVLLRGTRCLRVAGTRITLFTWMSTGSSGSHSCAR